MHEKVQKLIISMDMAALLNAHFIHASCSIHYYSNCIHIQVAGTLFYNIANSLYH